MDYRKPKNSWTTHLQGVFRYEGLGIDGQSSFKWRRNRPTDPWHRKEGSKDQNKTPVSKKAGNFFASWVPSTPDLCHLYCNTKLQWRIIRKDGNPRDVLETTWYSPSQCHATWTRQTFIISSPWGAGSRIQPFLVTHSSSLKFVQSTQSPPL